MRDYLPTLDGWRAIAIALVLFTHVRLPGGALQQISPYGAMGVHLFFAISGFLITNRLLEDRSGLRAFYVRRAFRILPAAFLYLAVLFALGFVGGWIPLNAGQLWASAFFYRNYYVLPADQGWYTGHYWSLSVEEHFYLLWPALLLWLGTRRARWGRARAGLRRRAVAWPRHPLWLGGRVESSMERPGGAHRLPAGRPLLGLRGGAPVGLATGAAVAGHTRS